MNADSRSCSSAARADAVKIMVASPSPSPRPRVAAPDGLCNNGTGALRFRRMHCMSQATTDGRDGPSFAETALRLGGKGEDEVRRLGAVDRADEHVETLYAARRRTEG